MGAGGSAERPAHFTSSPLALHGVESCSTSPQESAWTHHAGAETLTTNHPTSSSPMDHSALHTGDDESSSTSSLLSQFLVTPPSAAVIGGGMAGVHVAYELARLGFDVSVFEHRPVLAYSGNDNNSSITTPRAGSAQEYPSPLKASNGSPLTYSTGISSTAGSIPFVGVGMLHTAIFDHTVWQHVWNGLFSRSACPNIVIRDAFLPTLFSPEFYQWRRGRRRCLFHDREEVLLYGNRLSRVSREVVEKMTRDHPSLASYILRPSPPLRIRNARHILSKGNVTKKTKSGDVRIEEEEKERKTSSEVGYVRGSREGEVVQDGMQKSCLPSHDAPLYIDPVGWTRALAQICHSMYNVRFFTQHRVESIHVSFRDNTEMVSSLTISSPADSYSPSPKGGQEDLWKAGKEKNGEEDAKKMPLNIANDPHSWVSEKKDEAGRVVSAHRFDVVVMAAGGETGKLCRSATPIPILPVSSALLSVISPTPAWRDALRKLFPSSSSSGREKKDMVDAEHANLPAAPSSSFALTALHPDANLYGYYLPIRRNPVEGVSHSFVPLTSLPSPSCSTPSSPPPSPLLFSSSAGLMAPLANDEKERSSVLTRQWTSFLPSPWRGSGGVGGRNDNSKEKEAGVHPQDLGLAVMTTNSTITANIQHPHDQHPVLPHQECAQDEICVNGLWSTDVSTKSTMMDARKKKMIARLRAYFSIYGGIDLPADFFHDTSSQRSHAVGGSQAMNRFPSATPSAVPPASSVKLHEYISGITPDGLPIVDNYGGFFNAFICAGFGNRNPDWAPGAAVLLRYLVHRQSQALRLEHQHAAVAATAAHLGDVEEQKKKEAGGKRGGEVISILPNLPLSCVEETEMGLQQLFNGVFPDEIDKKILPTTAPSFSSSASRFRQIFSLPTLVKQKIVQKSGTIFSSEAGTVVKKKERDEHRPPEMGATGTEKDASYLTSTYPSLITKHVVNPYGTNRFDRLLPLRSNPDEDSRSLIHLLHNWEEKYLIRYTEPWMRSINQGLISLFEADIMPVWLKEFSFYYLYDPLPPSEEARQKAVEMQHRMRQIIEEYEISSPPTSSLVNGTKINPIEKRASDPYSGVRSSSNSRRGFHHFHTSGSIEKNEEGEEEGGRKGVMMTNRNEEISVPPPSWSVQSRESGEMMERHAREYFSSNSSSVRV